MKKWKQNYREKYMNDIQTVSMEYNPISSSNQKVFVFLINGLRDYSQLKLSTVI